jgi:hypothetical protein
VYKKHSTIISQLLLELFSSSFFRTFVHIHYRTRVSLTSEHTDDDVFEGVNYGWENNDKVQQRQQQDMPAIIVNEVQVSPQQTSEDSRQEEEDENDVQQQNEFLEAKESRRNVVGMTKGNDHEDYGTSYNNIALPPQGIVRFAPYPLMNQHQHQQQQQILFQPNNQPLRVAALQSK